MGSSHGHRQHGPFNYPEDGENRAKDAKVVLDRPNENAHKCAVHIPIGLVYR